MMSFPDASTSTITTTAASQRTTTMDNGQWITDNKNNKNNESDEHNGKEGNNDGDSNRAQMMADMLFGP